MSPDDSNSLLCLCKVKFTEEDEEGFMLACDGCENWYHPSCLGMSEEEVERLDVYICALCAHDTQQRTTYKRLCKRTDCKQALLHAGKYCSSRCAFHYMAEQIPHDTNPKLLKQLAPFSTLAKPTTASAIHYAKGVEPSESDIWHDQLTRVEGALRGVETQLQALDVALSRWESSPAVIVRAVKKGRGGEDKLCGWERGGQTCAAPRRRCDRHQGWQKTAKASLELERAQLTRQRGVIVAALDAQMGRSEREERLQEASWSLNEALRRSKEIQQGSVV